LEFEPHDQYLQRRKKLSEIVEKGHVAYPTRYAWTHTATEILEKYGTQTAEELSAHPAEVRVAGRLVQMRGHGKAGFAHLLNQGGRLQIYVKLDVVGERAYELYRLLDLGDFIGVAGHLFRTKTNELTIRVERIELLTKALLPLPEKWHGLSDVESRFRQRYLDLISNQRVRNTFEKRAAVLREIRQFFDARGYLEVETPMMHAIAGGATARPFTTHHNTLDMDLYLRIAPELYLKRLVVGGLDRVYEINRNFRNEGISTQHNPEFTMLEFYEAYSDVESMMALTQELLAQLAQKICGSTTVPYGEHALDFSHIERMSMREAIVRHWPAYAGPSPSVADLGAAGGARKFLQAWNAAARAAGREGLEVGAEDSDGQCTGALFEAVAEEKLIQPVMIYDFPTAISPLSKRRLDDPSIVERFELYAAGMEIANGFSELNDPADQEARFREQIESGGDEAPKQLDEDYIRALAHGLPPTGGEGIGIDRVVMLLTDSHSIREVILFPLLRPAAPDSPVNDASTAEGPAAGASPASNETK
jgi:lysyl-tRNA synthetase class 2